MAVPRVLLSILYNRLDEERKAVEEQGAAARAIPADLTRFRTHIEMNRGRMLARSGDVVVGVGFARQALNALLPEKHLLTLRLPMKEVEGTAL